MTDNTEQPQYSLVTLPNGVQYKVGTTNTDEAVKEAKRFAQEELNQKAKDEFANAPTWMKPFMAGQDLTRTALDTLTMGGADKLADYMKGTPADHPESQTNITKAIRSRMGGADIAGDAIASMEALPTVVPKLIGAAGGGTIARGITGILGAGAEGGAYGAANAAARGQDVGEGTMYGAGAGAGGQAVAGLLTKPVNALAGYFENPVLAKAVPGKVAKQPTAVERVEAAAGNAEAKGGSQSDYRREFTKVQNKGGLTPEQAAAVDKVVSGDPATNFSKWLGDKMTNPLVLSGGSFLGLPAWASYSGGQGLKYVSSQGTKEAVDEVRRLMQNKPKIKGPLSDTEKLALGLRQQGYNWLSDENQ